MANEKTVKFVRSLAVGSTTTNAQSNLWSLKLIYEFWGFCVNGGSDLRNPGGMPTNALSMPVGFESGTLVLLASGSDGSTLLGDNVFTAASVNWTSASISSSWLVTWVSGSASTDDSIYKIKTVINSSSVLVDTFSGATPGSGSAKPFFTARSNINFRVVDFAAASRLSGFADNQYMVLQFNGNAINSGQLNSQAKLRVQSTIAAAGTATSIAITLSPSGSWNGSTFSDSTWELFPDIFDSSDAGGIGGTWIGVGNTGLISMFADQACIQYMCSGDWKSTSIKPSYLHIEVPQRLYPKANDPNPICASISCNSLASSFATNVSNFNGWLLANPGALSTSERSVSMAKTLMGHNFDPNVHTSNKATRVVNQRFVQALYNTTLRRTFISEVILMNRSNLTRFGLVRNQLRRAAFIPFGDALPNFAKYGANGEWVHLGFGILWPWDNGILQRGLFV